MENFEDLKTITDLLTWKPIVTAFFFICGFLIGRLFEMIKHFITGKY